MQNGNRKGIAQWSKTYAGKKFYTSILFLALPIILLVTFTFIPALDMVIFSFQNRDPYGTNPTYAGFSNYVTIFTDKDYLETFKNSLYYLVGSFIQQALALLLASILCSKIRAKGLFKGILFFPYLMNGVAVSIIFQRFFLKGQKGLTPDGTLNTILTTLGLDPILWFDVDRPFLANCCLVFISIWKYIGFEIICIAYADSWLPAVCITPCYPISVFDEAYSWVIAVAPLIYFFCRLFSLLEHNSCWVDVPVNTVLRETSMESHVSFLIVNTEYACELALKRNYRTVEDRV